MGEMTFIDLLNELQESMPELTIIVLEHRIQQFFGWAEEIYVLDSKGSIKLQGAADELLNQHYEALRAHGLRLPKNKEQVHQTAALWERQKGRFGNSTQEASTLLSDILQQRFDLEDISLLPKDALLSTEDLCFDYPENPILNGISTTVQRGQLIGLMGANGTGKSTMLYLLAKLLPLQRGKVYYDGHSIDSFSLEEYARKTGFIFQNPNHMILTETIHDELILGRKNFKLKFEGEEITQLLEDYYSFIDSRSLSPLHHPLKLSWGQKRRLNIAAVLMSDPDFIILDEPFIGQDRENIERILAFLQQLKARRKTIIVASHDLEVLSQSDQIWVIENGNLLQFAQKNAPRSVSPESEDAINQNTQNHNLIEPNSNGTAEVEPKSKPPESDQRRQKKSKKYAHLLNYLHNTEVQESFLYNIHPSVKFLALIFLSGIILLEGNLLYLTFGAIGVFALIFAQKIPLKTFIRQIRYIFIMTAIMVPMNILFNAPGPEAQEVLFYLIYPHFPIRTLVVYYTFRAALWILTLTSLSILYLNTTPPKQFVYGLLHLGVPYRFVFSLMVGLRYIPLIYNENQMIEFAQIARGMTLKKKQKVSELWGQIKDRITVLLIAILRKAETTAVAMESRGFGLHKQRTVLYQISWQKKDVALLVAVITLLVFQIVI